MLDHGLARIDQGLFGYDDGHRLLASSLRLPGDVASDLTVASDLVPGVRFAASDGYWTGFPVPALNRYSLMRTWSAPEMPRPGCVWTHLLLFDPILFETIADLSCLTPLARRPTTFDDRADYGRPLTLSPPDADVASKPMVEYDRERLTEILGVLYAGLEGPVETSRPGELDQLVMAVWSQQWPRLRRNFRFQTAATTDTEGSSKRFDLQLRIARVPLRNFKVIPGKDSMWLDVAANDIEISYDHALRVFLRKYGQDVRRQRGSFRPLAKVFAISISTNRSAEKDLPASIARWFPEQNDAATLKRDLMDGALLKEIQIEAVLYLCEVDKGRSLPAPSEIGLRTLSGNWNARSFDLMRLAEWAANNQGELANALLSTVSKVVPVAEFWSATEGFPEMRRKMVANEPELLDAEPISSLETEALVTLLDAVPPSHDIGAVLVRRLHSHIDRRIVGKALNRFPIGVLSEAIRKANVSGVDSSRDWLREVGAVPSSVLNPTVMAGIQNASILVAIAEFLGWLSHDVIRYGLEPWIAGLGDAQDDLSQLDRDKLKCFLFALAVVTGGTPAQQIFERTFEYLHDRIINSYLPWQAMQILESSLPSLGWTRDWDKALKLRLAVAQAYVWSDLDPQSFGRLLRGKQERKMLRRAAEEINGADRYANIVRD